MQPESSRQSKTSSATKSIMMADDHADFAVEQDCQIGMDAPNIGSGTGSNFYQKRRNSSPVFFFNFHGIIFIYTRQHICQSNTAPLSNRLMQLLMQIQCNHSQKQTENELLGTNRKNKSTEQYWIQFIRPLAKIFIPSH